MINNRKYLDLPKEQAYPHMGRLLEGRIRQSGRTHAVISRDLGIAQTGVARYLQQPSLQAGILWKVGLSIRHNFFDELAGHFPVAAPEKVAAQAAALAAKDARIAELEKELAIYKEIVLARR
jgi:hypothetical protein